MFVLFVAVVNVVIRIDARRWNMTKDHQAKKKCS